MKHLLNDLTEQEKNSIREQHKGGMNVVTENFSKLINSKSGDVKPLVNEQRDGDSYPDESFADDTDLIIEPIMRILKPIYEKYGKEDTVFFLETIIGIIDDIGDSAFVGPDDSLSEQEDDFFYKVNPRQEYYYDKNDKMASDVEDEMDVEEWDEDDFDNFYQKYPYGERQKTFPDNEHGRRWFKGYSKEHGGKFPVFKRKSKM
jgi:hypothetical protein